MHSGRFLIKAVTALHLLLAFFVSPSAMANQTLLSDHQGFYPRAVMISHDSVSSRNGVIIASVTGFESGGHEDIFASQDGGATFALAGTIHDSDFGKGLCCGGLYELPVAIGAMPAGSLLWAGSVGGDTPADPMQLKIFKSTDQGAHWSYLSNCATGTKPRSQGGLWEVEFGIAANGHLVCYYSDETQNSHSQVLRYVQSSDGVTWSAPTDVVSSSNSADRPGMANVVKLPSGHYLMSFEMCGPLNCAAYLKSSVDGLNWGDANDHGTAIQTADGATFWHTPTLAWSPVSGSATGQLVMQGQILVKNGAVQTGNGKTILLNAAGNGTGEWVAFSAPTAITMPTDTAGNYCQNYSSPLLPLNNGANLLEMASDFVTGTTCKTYINVAPLGGVKATAGNISVNKGSSASGDMTLRSSANYAGQYNLTVSIPNIPADITLSSTTVTLSATSDTTVHVNVTPTTLAAAKTSSGFQLASLFGLAVFGLIRVRRKNKRVYPLLALLLPLVLTACGGGGSGGGGGGVVITPPTTVTTTYAGTITATSVADSSITTSTPVSITITKTS